MASGNSSHTAGPFREQDSCGIGFVADIRGRRRHRILAQALEALVNLSHRGAVNADGRTGDGVGVLTQIPTRFFARYLEDRSLPAVAPEDLAVGSFFWPPERTAECRELIASVIAGSSLELVAWRPVPMAPEILGDAARRRCPAIWQAILRRTDEVDAEEFERLLYLARRRIERRSAKLGLDRAYDDGIYVVSLSSRTLVYKGMCLAAELADFYPDLRDPSYETAPIAARTGCDPESVGSATMWNKPSMKERR